MAAAVAEACATGTSTRKVAAIVDKVGISHLSKDQVSSMARSVDADVEELMSRPVDGLRTPYVWLDAIYCKARVEGHVASVAVVTAIGCDEDGWRRVLGMGVVDTGDSDRFGYAKASDGGCLLSVSQVLPLRYLLVDVFDREGLPGIAGTFVSRHLNGVIDGLAFVAYTNTL